jgi:hypothetical protein
LNERSIFTFVNRNSLRSAAIGVLERSSVKLDEEPRRRLRSQAHLKVAMLQMVSEGAVIEANARKGEEFCRRAADCGADVALFPEMWSVGYAKYPSGDDRARAEWLNLAVARDGPFVDRFRHLARELRIAIAITYLETGPALPRNALTLVDSEGLDVSPMQRCTPAHGTRRRNHAPPVTSFAWATCVPARRWRRLAR